MRLIYYFAIIFGCAAGMHFIFAGTRAPLWTRLTQPLIFTGALFLHRIALNHYIAGATRLPAGFFEQKGAMLWTLFVPTISAAIAFACFLRIATRIRRTHPAAWNLTLAWTAVAALAWLGYAVAMWFDGRS